jgi:ZIP family zinc transporter
VSPDAPGAIAEPVPVERSRAMVWLLALAPLVLLGALLASIIGYGPSRMLQTTPVPPVERLAITHVMLTPSGIELSVLNDGPDEVTIAQVMVDDAFWTFTASHGTRLPHLARTRLSIPYPWVHGETHGVRLLTSTGLTFDHVIPVAVETPRPNARYFGVFALIGTYVGVVPVALGLLWYPLMRRIGRRGLQFLMALTIGLLAYLLVDSAHDGLAIAATIPGSLQGTALFVFGACAAYLMLDLVGTWLGHRRRAAPAGVAAGWVLAMLIAIGIGLHNFGEGLAIGSAFALGELALGTLLIVGFTLHNTTEGLAIIAPLASDSQSAPPPIARLMQLGLVGGVPTILGAWLGAFVNSPVIAVLFLALGVGAIAQVTRQILAHSAGAGGAVAYFREAHVVGGLAAGVLVMYATGLIVG